jgi:hypothetical protein
MATIKKAQLGGLIKKGVKVVTKTTPKKITKYSSEAEQISAGKKPFLQKTKEATSSLDGTPGVGKNKSYSKKGLEMAVERRLNPEAAKKKMTPAQRRSFEVDDSYRKNGGKVGKMKNGGSLSALNASNKRVGPIDPKGAFTKVQKKTLAGAKGKASLTKDKQLGATKMAKKGMSVKKK